MARGGKRFSLAVSKERRPSAVAQLSPTAPKEAREGREKKSKKKAAMNVFDGEARPQKKKQKVVESNDKPNVKAEEKTSCDSSSKDSSVKKSKKKKLKKSTS